MRYFVEGDALFAFDSAAHDLRGDPRVLSFRSGTSIGVPSRGSLSAALAAAMRAASSLRGDADSVELVLISPFAAEEFDAATSAIRAAWPGRIRAGSNSAAVSAERSPSKSITTFVARRSRIRCARRSPLHRDSTPGASKLIPFGSIAALSRARRTPRGRNTGSRSCAGQRRSTRVATHGAAHVDTAGAVIAGDGAQSRRWSSLVRARCRSADRTRRRALGRWLSRGDRAEDDERLRARRRDPASARGRSRAAREHATTRRGAHRPAVPMGRDRHPPPTPPSRSSAAPARSSPRARSPLAPRRRAISRPGSSSPRSRCCCSSRCSAASEPPRDRA